MFTFLATILYGFTWACGLSVIAVKFTPLERAAQVLLIAKNLSWRLIYLINAFMCVTVVKACIPADTVMKQYEQYMNLQHNFFAVNSILAALSNGVNFTAISRAANGYPCTCLTDRW